MKAVSYVRVSSEEQKNGDGPERQEQGAIECAAKHGLEIYNTLKDIGYSASKGEHISHGALGKYLKECDKGMHRGEGLIAERQDRLSRLGNTETTLLFYRLITAGVTVFLYKEDRIIRSIKDLDEMGMAIQTTVRACADQEFSKKLSERVSSAWAGKKDAARTSGAPYGKHLHLWLALEGQIKSANKIVVPGKIVVIPEKVALVKEIYTLAAQGVGSRNICRQLNGRVGSRSWVSKTLNNRAVLGEFQPGKKGEVIQNFYPQIISQSEFDAARAQMKAKWKSGAYIGGNRRNSNTAANLFSGLFHDITFQPERSMDFQTVRQHTHYIMTAFSSGAPSNRMRYDKLEKALLGFFLKVNWADIAGESDSAEYKAAKVALETKLRLKDAVSREITSNTEAMVGEDVDTRKYFMRQIAKDEAVLTTLTEEIDALRVAVDEAQAKTADLAETKTFLEMLNQLNSNPALRLPLKAAIKKKVNKIELVFMPDRQGVVAFVQYTNGASDATVVLNRDLDESAPWFATMPPALRNSGNFRIQRIRNKTREFHEALKKDVLQWVRSFQNASRTS
jgi:DNA invertase Pin-like site-specific DNA recombinase